MPIVPSTAMTYKYKPQVFHSHIPNAAIAFEAVKINKRATNPSRVTPSGVLIIESVANEAIKLWITIMINQIDQPVPLFGLLDNFFFGLAINILLVLV